jgi:hypothetical protein
MSSSSSGDRRVSFFLACWKVLSRMQQFPLTAGSSYTSDVGTCLAGSFDELICRF